MVNLKKYIENLHRYNDLENDINVGNTDYATFMRNQSLLKRDIKIENDKIIDSLLELENKPLSLEEKKNLDTNVGVLFSPTSQLDTMIGFTIYKILLFDAINRNDINQTADYNYYCGLCYFYLTHNLSGIQYNKYFDDSTKYLKYINELPLLVKRHLISSYGNRMMPYINKNHKKVISITKEVLALFESFSEEEKEELNIKSYILAIYKNLSTTLIGYETKEIDYNDFLYVYDCIEKMVLLKEYGKDLNSYRETNVTYTVLFAKYLNKEISLDEFINGIDPLCIPNDSLTESENYLRVFDMNAKYIFFIHQSNIEKDRLKEIVNERLNQVLTFVKKINKSELSFYFDEKILNFIVPISNILDNTQAKDIIYDITVSRHLPTYVHSLMVNKLSMLITEYAIKNMPEEFVAILKCRKEEVINHKKEILDLVYNASILHDIGKWVCIDIISNSSRRLFDIEFALIKEHPTFGYELVKDTNFHQAIKDTILYHQRSYDKKIGYPNDDKDAYYQVIVDIVMISDCLDAATDFIGRPYAKMKTYDELVNEFLDGENTRYSKFVELLKDEKLSKEIKYIINEERINIINDAYKKLQKF